MRRPSIRVAEPVLNGNERAYVLDCLDSTWISSRGKYIEQFEQDRRRFLRCANTRSRPTTERRHCIWRWSRRALGRATKSLCRR